MKKYSNRKTNLMILIPTFLFLSLILGLFHMTYKKHRDTVVTQQVHQMTAFASTGANYLKTFMKEKNLEFLNTFTFGQLGNSFSEVEHKVETQIKKYQNQSPVYMDLLRFYSMNETRTQTLAGLSNRELITICEKALQSNELFFSPAVIVNQNNVGIYVIKGIFNQYRKYGFVIGRINLSSVFRNTLGAITPGNGGFFTISDINGTKFCLTEETHHFQIGEQIKSPAKNEKLLSGHHLVSIGDQPLLITASLPYNEIRQPILITFYLLITISIGLVIIILSIAWILLYQQKKKLSYEMERELTKEVNESNRNEVIGLFSRKVAHEYNNFLTPITIYCELLSTELDKETEAYDYVKEIEQSVSSCTQLAKELLAFGRSQTLNHEMISYDSTACIKDAIEKIRLTIPPHITIETELTHKALYLNGQPLELVQILYNLIGNSVDALENRPSPKIHISYQDDGSDGILIISDNGCGIPYAVQKKILSTKFTTKTDGKGNGLGLMIVVGIVDKYDGTITFTSTPNVGTEFILHFPCNS